MKKVYNHFVILKNKLITLVYSKYYNIIIGKKVIFRNTPLIIKRKNAKIIIDSHTIINSSNNGYHINMHSKCKLYADRDNAIIKIGKNSRIHGTCIHAYNSITIGDNCLIAANTQIIDGNGHKLSFENLSNRINTTDNGKPIIIGNNVWIGANTIILGGTEISDGTVISAGSIVSGIIPAKCIYGGNPARLIKSYL